MLNNEEYSRLEGEVSKRAKELYLDSDIDNHLVPNYNFRSLMGKFVDKAIRELIVDNEDKWTIIQWACTDTDGVFYEGAYRSRLETPYNRFRNDCISIICDYI